MKIKTHQTSPNATLFRVMLCIPGDEITSWRLYDAWMGGSLAVHDPVESVTAVAIARVDPPRSNTQ